MSIQPVRIVVSSQRGFVFDIADVQTLRTQHHICGILTGTLPQVGQQNVFLGLPMMLLPEEVVLLVKNKLAVLVDDNAAHLPPSLEQANAYHEARGAAIEKQQLETVKYDDQREARMREVHKDKIEKKRGEREKAREGLAKLPVEGEVVEIFVPDLPEGERTTGPPPSLLPTASTSRPLNTVSYLITIKLSSKKEAWYDPASATYSDLEAAGAAGLWNYPTTPLQASRCKVFEDLWRKGHFMGGGLRFGGDFLVYPGDPLRFHSHFTLTVLSSPNSTILPLDLIAYGRLATAVKKAHLLASWNEKEEKADYFSLEWAAFG